MHDDHNDLDTAIVNDRHIYMYMYDVVCLVVIKLYVLTNVILIYVTLDVDSMSAVFFGIFSRLLHGSFFPSRLLIYSFTLIVFLCR